MSSAEETAKELYRVLTESDLLRADDARRRGITFRTTGPSEAFLRLSHRFLGPEIDAVAAASGELREADRARLFGKHARARARPASGYLLEADGYRLVLDLGNGAFGALQRYVDLRMWTRSSSRTCTPTTASI